MAPSRSQGGDRWEAESWHEQYEKLSPTTQDLHRALRSVIEEFDAVDWYQQRIDLTPDPELKAILAHNRDEEKEHASMILEWLRRHDPGFGASFRTYLFTEGDLTKIEEAADAEEPAARPGDVATKAEGGSTPPERVFTVGSLKPGR
ncbi:MAG: ferritin-like domain-containing protein [Myxococcales bacterium]